MGGVCDVNVFLGNLIFFAHNKKPFSQPQSFLVRIGYNPAISTPFAKTILFSSPFEYIQSCIQYSLVFNN